MRFQKRRIIWVAFTARGPSAELLTREKTVKLLYKSPDGKHVDAVLAQADTCLSDGTTGMSK